MPIYEYRCESCSHDLEAFQKMADPPLTDCPACNEPALKKRISAVAFRLKGSGWYETDFKTGDKKKNILKPEGTGTEAGKPGESAAKGETGGKKESAPAG